MAQPHCAPSASSRHSVGEVRRNHFYTAALRTSAFPGPTVRVPSQRHGIAPPATQHQLIGRGAAAARLNATQASSAGHTKGNHTNATVSKHQNEAAVPDAEQISAT